MTSVVFDGKFLAADTRHVHELDYNETGMCPHCRKAVTRLFYSATKILTPKTKVYFNNSRIIAVSGSGLWSTISAIFRVLETGLCSDTVYLHKLLKAVNIHKEIDDYSTTLILTEDAVYLVEKLKCKQIHKLPITLGSGSFTTKKFLVEKKITPMQAIYENSKLDDCTSSKVEYITMSKNKDFRKRVFKPIKAKLTKLNLRKQSA